MSRLRLLPAVLLAALTALLGASAGLPARPSADIPPEFARLYKDLEHRLDLVESGLAALPAAEPAPGGTVFTAELLTANGNRGADLLNPQVVKGSLLQVKRLQEMGFRGVWISLMYPLLAPGSPRQAEYLEFYRRVTAGARSLGMSVGMDMGTLFSDPAFSRTPHDYKSLTLESFAAGMRGMAEVVLRELKPDYLGLLNEPDTQSKNTGLDLTPDNLRLFGRSVLRGLDRGRTLIGIGAGTWSPAAYFEMIARDLPVDCIDIHLYPINRDFQTGRLAAIARLAAENRKRIVVGESWLYKAGDQDLGGNIASAAGIFRRDVFDFWAPLDERYLGLVMRLARSQGMPLANFFWSRNFFGGLPYDAETKSLSPEEAFAALNKRSVPNLLNGGLTPLGQAVKRLLND